MEKLILNIFKFTLFSAIILFVFGSNARIERDFRQVKNLPPDSIPIDTFQLLNSELIYPLIEKDKIFTGTDKEHPFYMEDPKNIKTNIEYEPQSREYKFTEKIGETPYGPSNTMSFNEFQKFDMDKELQKYWRERAKNSGFGSRNSIIPKLNFGGELLDKIFGNTSIDIRPSGSAELIFGVIYNKRDDPAISVKQRSTTNFDFQMKIQMSVDANIGDKIKFKTNYNTEATFDFENKIKLKYEGKEDEIIKLIEAGDVSMPLNSQLIPGSQALFGLKTKLQFGKTTVTAVYSEQKSQTSSITVAGGAQTSSYAFKADQYEESKHYFTSQYFYNHYNRFLNRIPLISSPVNIVKIEVWKTNIGAATTDNRNIIAFTDVGEFIPANTYFQPNFAFPHGYDSLPDKNANNMFLANNINKIDSSQVRNINTVSSYLSGKGLIAGQDYEKVELARKLTPQEYTYNSKLGFISLNTSLNPDQVLAVAYQFQIIGDTTVYQVGEFSNEVNAPNSIIVKLVKSSSLNTQSSLWKLMMKNVYSLGAYQVNKEDFRLNVLYSGDNSGVPNGFFTEGPKQGIPLIKLMGLDRLNTQLDPEPDGIFDFIDQAATNGGTIQASNGRIFFPTVEPFGKDMRALFCKDCPDTTFANKYAYDSLYTLTKTGAQQFPDKNKYILEGFYKSASGSEISIGMGNIPQGSVRVSVGGIVLTENVDYTVDYTMGRVRIINEGILNSGTPINISTESNTLMNFQTKRFIGAHVNYEFNKDFNIGATILNLREKPITQKVNFGDEPINNTIWGLDLAYQTDSRFITKLVDFLPLIQTKAPSKINFYGEFAQFIPGHSSAIGTSGTSYIDDFEGTKSSIDLKNIATWNLASTPLGQSTLFPEATTGTLAYGFNRAKLAWYVIDPLFYRSGSEKPSNITSDDQSKPYAREILENEIFPNKQAPNGQPTNIAVLNLAYYPSERGPYNYDVNTTPFSAGLNADGTLKNPETRWGGIMRKIETTDFDATNVEYIEFWMMDPFITVPNHTGGKLYFNLGDISEDILRDGRKSFENGLPTTATITNVDTTIWGIVPTLQPVVNAFDNDPAARPFQDVGYDGLRDSYEQAFFSGYVQNIATTLGPTSQAYIDASNDPSADDFHYFRGTDLDNADVKILDRYKLFNGPDGNSTTPQELGTTLPNVEDINNDNTLSEEEKYYQYHIDLKPDKMVVGENYITDMYEATGVPLANGSTANCKWYQFKIPVRSPEKVIGQINGFQSVRFLRMFLSNFSQEVVCRFATFELVKSDWRKYTNDLLSPGDYVPGGPAADTKFELSAVSIEENGARIPIPYVLPPDINREINSATTNLQQLNEQSLVMRVYDLLDGDARACYKTTTFDLRQFKKLKMYVHAEKLKASENMYTGDLSLFIRLGSDFTQNYYEYELPLAFTTWGTPATDDRSIWPDQNQLEIELQKFIDAKQNRNIDFRNSVAGVSISNPYIVPDGSNRITVMGAPNIADVRTIMIGIRNPKKKALGDNDDMLPKSAEIWVNELRLTDFNEYGGWAATARIRTNLADLGDLQVAGQISTPGFGSLEKKINERQKEQITQFDIATNLELGKFLGAKSGVRIPMHYDYSNITNKPLYNPLNPDTKLQSDLDSYDNSLQSDSIKNIVNDVTIRKNINFMNMRKDRTGSSNKVHLWDVENFDLSYAYSEISHRNIDIEYDTKKKHVGGLGYNFSMNPKNVRPFSKFKFLKSKSLAAVKDFNFYYAPRTLGFRTDINREFSEKLLRAKSIGNVIIDPSYIKIFEWNRFYTLKYDLTQSLKIDYSATSNARIDEPPGKIDTKTKQDSIFNNILGFGRMTRYNQNIDINYTIPINKIPILNWVSVNAKYGGTYRWEASPLSLKEMGNTIENSNTKQVNANLNFVNLYNKIDYLKKINSGQSTSTKKETIPVKNAKGIVIKSSAKSPKTGKNLDSTEVVETPNYLKIILDNTLRLIMSARSASVNYSINEGILLPGFTKSPVMVGQDFGSGAPGLDFVFGGQRNIRPDAVMNNWLTTDTLMNYPYLTKKSEVLNFRATLEPLPDFKIELTANRNYTEMHQEYYKYNSVSNQFAQYSPTTTGNFSMSFMMIGTSFTDVTNKENSSILFERFKDYRMEIANRLASANPNWDGTRNDTTNFPMGYGATSQDVLIPAFLAAYAGKNASKVSLKAFPTLPLPNWRITYTGLSKIKMIKKWFSSITLSHGYTSSYSVGSFITNIRYQADADGYQYVKDVLGNYLPSKEIGMILITEQFSPLISIDMTWKNSLLTKFEYKKSRNYSLSFSNNQLTDVTSSEFVIGLGYRIKNIEYIFRAIGLSSSKGKKQKSDLNIKADFSVRDNRTVLRKIVEAVDQISSGQTLTSINVSAEYQISQKVTAKLFFDDRINTPYVSSQFPITNMNTGISIKFTL